MKKHFTKDFLRTVTALGLALVIGLGVNYAVADWQGPSGAPTSGNPNNLLTTGFDQIKTGKLSVKSTTPPPILGSGPGAFDVFGLQVGDYTNAYSAAHKGIWSNGPLGVAGNTILAGNVEIGPTLQTAQNPVTLNVTGTANVIGAANVTDNLRVSDKEIIGAGNITTNPAYNLHLVGDTNIGMGNSCTLTSDHATDGCPIGSYVSNVVPASQCPNSTWYGMETGSCVNITCRYVNPVTNPVDLGNCYGSGSGSGSGGDEMNMTLVHHWPRFYHGPGQSGGEYSSYGGSFNSTTNPNDGIGHQASSNSAFYNITDPNVEWSAAGAGSAAELVPTLSPVCLIKTDGFPNSNARSFPLVLDANQETAAPITGGNPPYTYQWYQKSVDGIVNFNSTLSGFTPNNPTANNWTTWGNAVTGSSQKVALITSPNITNQNGAVLQSHWWAVKVTDNTGESDFGIFGAHDMFHCSSNYSQ